MSTQAVPVGGPASVGHAEHPAARVLIRRHYLRWWESLPWLAAAAFYFAFPDYLGFGTSLMITVLFALSLDLALGYAGRPDLTEASFVKLLRRYSVVIDTAGAGR